jgi:uncharacterized membrane protein
MSDEMGNTPPPMGDPAAPEQPWTQTNYTAPPPPPAGYIPPPVAGSGLSDTAAGAIAYLTFIPAVIFLVIDPYKQKPFVKFHCIQELGLTVVAFLLHFLVIIPFLGLLIDVVGSLALFVVWIICILKASQGGAFKIPFLSDFASQQSGYVV